MYGLTNSFIITLTMLSANPSYSGDYGAAADAARRAVMETPTMKKQVKRGEKYVKDSILPAISMTEAELAYLAWALPVASGKISTKPFKNLKLKTKSWTLRPELEYSFQGQEQFDGKLILNYEWD